ncbi:MAG: hypothetical protein JXR05_12545 [Flavobacteriaceae bacterium]
MTKKLLLLFFLILFTCQIQAQKKQQRIIGKVIDSTGTVEDAHILNLRTNKGTFSTKGGDFKIFGIVGDSLQVSSVQHETVFKIITLIDLYAERIFIRLYKKSYQLDEIVLKEHNLTGVLISDRKKVPIQKGLKEAMGLMELINSYSMSEILYFPIGEDEIHLTKTPARTDPTKNFKGVGTSISLGSGNRKKLKLQKITSNAFNSKKLTNIIGEKFFIKLKIPKELIYDFIDYCKKFNIRQLYEQDKLLELLKLLEEKSVVYLETIK